ncbi:MAG: efflux RND transporter periplasmic adaptor subunit [Thermoanaerobaculia bacterium]
MRKVNSDRCPVTGQRKSWMISLVTGHRSLVTVLALVVATACPGAKQKPADEKVPVTVAKAEHKDVPTQLQAIGTVQPLSTVAVKALVDGQLQRVWFREGDDVRRGQVLFTIDQRPYQASLMQAQANLARDQAQLRNSEAQAARYADLVKKDYVTKEEYDRITSGAEAAKAVVAADRANVQTAQLQLAYCEIRSPIDGRTGGLQVHAGNIVHTTDTTPLVVINQVSPISVQFAMPERDLQTLRTRAGTQSIPVQAVQTNGSGAVAQGKLSFLDNAVNAQTGTITLKAAFPNNDRALWPGQYVNIVATLATQANAVVIPSQAVQIGQQGQYVYVVKADDGVEMRPVTVSRSVGQQAIIGTGVSAGETVVTDGQVRLTPKSKVDVKNKV